MGIFGSFKKKRQRKSVLVGIATTYGEIWKIEDKNSFIVALFSRVSEKCNDGIDMDALTASERVFYIVQSLETEVNNGGFKQFFYNFGGDFANEAEQSLRQIGAEYTACIMRKALSALGEALPSDQTERQNLLEQTDENVQKTWTECDCEFYRYTDDLAELSYQFVLKNKNDF